MAPPDGTSTANEGDGAAAPRRLPLGERLVQRGDITRDQLDEALKLSKSWKMRLGDVLIAKGWVTRFPDDDAPPAQSSTLETGNRTEAAAAAPARGSGADTGARGAGAAGRPLPLGEVFVDRGVITREQLNEALELSRKWGMRLGEVLLAKGWVTAFRFYNTLAEQQGLEFVNLLRHPPEEDLLREDEVHDYISRQTVPYRYDKLAGRLIVATTDPFFARRYYSEQLGHNDFDVVVTSKFDLLWTLQSKFSHLFTNDALNSLLTASPKLSAKSTFSPGQVVFFFVFSMILLFSLFIQPIATILVVNAALSVIFLSTLAFKLLITVLGGTMDKLDQTVTKEEVDALTDEELPTFTILVPMYKEPEVMPIIAAALRSMDYPLPKLDIKLVLEEGDHSTIEAAKAESLESIFEIVRVPDSQPKTKPKACNYALAFARGKYTVIFDAEDKPEPDQLKKVVVAFSKASDDTVCIQARLNYFNWDENWLTKMFTIDYSLWFDFMLPALDYLRMPLPLGGTSNHFRTDILRELGAWDPYNVTEDADLGVRMNQKKYRVGVINSTTMEEANSQVGNWIRQRSRWIKGYMQTYLVHLRNPFELYRTLGFPAFMGFHLFIGGNVISGLFNPIFWFLYFFFLITGSTILEEVFPPALLYVNLFTLIVGNLGLTYLAALAPIKRRYYELIPLGLTVLGYWVLISIAAYKALYQLITNPYYWEKTQHGISKYTASEVAKARAGRNAA